jgi:ornithine cyclodeaminase/alanine dehydrogenase-like protein (mu-crystallin family)
MSGIVTSVFSMPPFVGSVVGVGDELPVVRAEDIHGLVDTADLIEPVRSALADVSSGLGESGVLTFAPLGPLGDVQVKTAWLPGHRYFTVKVATWFTARGAASGSPTDGYVAVHDARTGEPVVILRDEHHLTDVRTAAAATAAITALARPDASRVGVLGTGTQAYLQAVAAVEINGCTTVTVWGRRPDQASRLRDDLAIRCPGTTITAADTPEAVVAAADVVVTATASRVPLVRGDWLRRGQLVVSLGADDPAKHELDPHCFRRADRVIVDSVADTPRLAGDLHAAVADGAVSVADLVELGGVLGGRDPGRGDAEQIVIVKLIGLGAQDLAAAEVAVRKLAVR